MNIFSFILKINSDSKYAATIALIAMVSIIIFCTAWLIIKRLHLKKKYHADEQFVKEYKEQLKQREQSGELNSDKPELIGEDF